MRKSNTGRSSDATEFVGNRIAVVDRDTIFIAHLTLIL